MVYNGSTSKEKEKSWYMSLYILIHCRMANFHRQPRERPSTPPFQGVQGLVFQGLFYLSDLPMECFHSKKAHDHYYASFIGHCVEVEYTINMHFFFNIDIPRIFRAWGWEPFVSLHGLTYPHYVLIFYVNIHSTVNDMIFSIAMCGQTFLVLTSSICRALGMPRVFGQLLVFSLEV